MTSEVSDLNTAGSKLNESIEPGEADSSFEIEKTPVKTTKLADNLIDESHDCIIRDIYLKSKRRLNMEMCLRIEDLIRKNRMDLNDLQLPELVNILQFLEKYNIEIFDKYLDEFENYEDDGKLNLFKLVRGVQKIQNMADIKSPDPPLQLQRVGPHTPPPMTPEQEVAYEFDRIGYKYVYQKQTRLVTIRLPLRKEPGIDETIEFPDPKNSYGVKLSSTRFGKTCYVTNLPKGEEGFFEQQLFSLFAKAGRILEMKIECLSNQPTGEAFVTFSTRKAAKLAIKILNGHLFLTGQNLIVEDYKRENHIRLMLFNISMNFTLQEIRETLNKTFYGIRKINEKPHINGSRRFLFIDFIDNKHAQICYDYFLTNTDGFCLDCDDESATCVWYIADVRPYLKVCCDEDKINEENMRRIFAKFGSLTFYEKENHHCALISLGSIVDHMLAVDELFGTIIDGSKIKMFLTKLNCDEKKNEKENVCENSILEANNYVDRQFGPRQPLLDIDFRNMKPFNFKNTQLNNNTLDYEQNNSSQNKIFGNFKPFSINSNKNSYNMGHKAGGTWNESKTHGKREYTDEMNENEPSRPIFSKKKKYRHAASFNIRYDQ